MSTNVRYQGKFDEKLFKAYAGYMVDLVDCAFSYDELEAFARGRNDHPGEVMSLNMARKLTELYSHEVKEWGEAWEIDKASEKSEDELMHERAVAAFLNLCSARFDIYGKMIDEVGDSGKTIDEAKEIIEQKAQNEGLLGKIIDASNLLPVSATPEHVIVYQSGPENTSVHYLQANMTKLVRTLGHHCHTGEFVDYSEHSLLRVGVNFVLETLAENSHYKKISSRARRELYDNNSTVPGFMKALKKLLADKKISIERELQDDLQNLEYEHAWQTKGKIYYSYEPHKTRRGGPGERVVFTDPVDALVCLLGARNEQYGIIVGDKNIAACLKNSGDEIIKKLLTRECQQEVLTKIKEVVDLNRWILPKAYSAVQRAKKPIARGR